jgi:hypothetical protein
MKIFWLTPGQLVGALFIGLSIVLFSMYVMIPHPVEVPIQIITPVPTPPPVVITERPIITAQPTSLVDYSQNLFALNSIDSEAIKLFNLIAIMLFIIPIIIILYMLIGVTGRIE